MERVMQWCLWLLMGLTGVIVLAGPGAALGNMLRVWVALVV